MKVILLPRGQGKTLRLILRADETKYYIVCPSRNDCSEIFQRAKDMGRLIHFPMTFHDFIKGEYGPQVRGVLIDNADLLLQKISKVGVDTITLTKEEGQ